MVIMELKYTPRIINEIETEAKKPVQDVLADFSVKTLVLFVKKGLNVDESVAFDEMEKYLAEGGDTVTLYTDIMESLQKAGFLPRELNLKRVKEDMSKALKQSI